MQRRLSQEPVPETVLSAAEDLLARLIARAYAADHPELFVLRVADQPETQPLGPPPAAKADADAPAAQDGGPGQNWSLERHDESAPIRRPRGTAA